MANILAPIIITGCRRSGTTLLRTMLEQHPALKVHPDEPQFIQKLARRFGSQITQPQVAIEIVTTHPYCPPNVTREALQAGLLGRTSLSLSEFIHLYLTVWGGADLQSRHAVLKDPEWIFYLDQLFAWFPEAKMIHLVRDPRANVSSQRARWQKATVYECAVWWRDAVRAGHALSQTRPEVCFELVYEKLVVTPEETLTEMCNFLQIPFAPEMLTFDLETPTYTPGTTPQRTRFTHTDTTRLNLWQKHLTPLEICLIEVIGKNEMGWWNYEPTREPAAFLPLALKYLWEGAGYTLLKTARTIRTKWRKEDHLRREK